MKNIIKGIFSDYKNDVPIYLLGIGAIIIFIVGWNFTHDIYQSVDILFWDEANYMQSGKLITEKFNKSWGPSYAIWYKFISIFEFDSVKLYYLNFRLMTILPAIAIFIFLAISNIRFWVSLSLGLFFIFADINLPTWPKISHYCILVFLTGMILMKYIPSNLVKISFISLFALNISYARPEFYLTYLAIIGLWFIALCYKDFRTKPAIIFSIVIFIFGLAIQKYMGNPLFNFNGDRSALAFAQHFMLNYFTWNNIDQDFWITWMSYYDQLFGEVTSIKEAYNTNPRMFNLHFLTNFQEYFSKAFMLFSDAMLPDKLINIPTNGRITILIIGGIIMIAAVFDDRYLEVLHQSIKRNLLSIFIILLFIAPTLISCFLIYPRIHYIVFHFVALIFIISIIVFSKSSNKGAFDQYSALFITVVLTFIYFNFPSSKDYHHFDLWRAETSQANLKTIEKIQSYNLQDTIHILENEGGMNIFLGDNFKWVRGFMKDTTWTAYLEREHVDIVYVTPSLTKYPTLKNDSTWIEFVKTPENYNFVKVSTGAHTPYIYLHQNILNPQ